MDTVIRQVATGFRWRPKKRPGRTIVHAITVTSHLEPHHADRHIKKENGRMVFNPGSETLLENNDTLVVVGQSANIKGLEKLLAPA